MSSKDDRNCNVGTHTIGGSETPADTIFPIVTGLNTIFEDQTNNHNKTLINIQNNGGAPIVVNINTRECGGPIVFTLIPGQRRVFQVEDFESLTVTATTDGTISLFVQKTFCICCEEEEN
ncbi:hypothetical protein QUF79_17540 [Fictibacillus enclensis]|uniref:S-Ena type endospore appendage n=1 Tax=Fictibacillus enclensis TaxID=1017270 RepID=UPI0025A0C48D|nr:S-Ena type endospore appendage [Fictibacillus enclensis]MDM5199820.1 hypothetical protein [Fictibacillus enclensis]